MADETVVVLSPYFSKNTKLVANICTNCYLEAKNEDLFVTGVNTIFLKKYEPENYQNFLNYNSTKSLTDSKSGMELKVENMRGLYLNHLIILKMSDEIKKDYYVPVTTTKWIAPMSPHNLIEESYYNNPWALLVVTIFLNKVSGKLALPFIEKFFETFKGPHNVVEYEISQLEPYFTKIGLGRIRATRVWRLSFDFINKDWSSVRELYGVGKYAEDAYRMFCLGDFNVQPTDRYLKIYKAWYEMTFSQKKIEIPKSQVFSKYFKDEDRTEEENNEYETT